jgi:putative ABC transport system permease protein
MLPVRGQVFHEASAGAPVAVLTYGLWQRRFGGRSDVAGMPVTVNGQSYTVLGVLPKEFEFPATIPSSANIGTRAIEFFTPLELNSENHSCRSCHNYSALGLLKPGVTAAMAQADMDRVGRELVAEYPADNRDDGIRVTDLQEHTSGALRPALLMILAAMACVLLIACVNVANLLLARGTVRAREIGLRVALGASRGQLIRQLLIESGVLGLLGAGLGLLLARWGLQAMIDMAPDNIDRLASVHINGRILVFTLGVSVLTSLLFGLLPALQLSGVAPGAVLAEGARGSSGGRRAFRSRSVLAAAQMTLSVVLLIGAGLLLRSYLVVRSQDAGFDIDHSLSFYFVLPSRYDSTAQRQFVRRAVERLEQVPGVVSAAFITVPPLSALGNTGTVIPDGMELGPNKVWPDASYRRVSREYLATMQIQVLQGRDFSLGDSLGAPLVALLTDGLARRLFGAASPVGRTVRVWGGRREVVGVIRGVREFGLDLEAPLGVYVPAEQEQSDAGGFVVRFQSDPARSIDTVRRTMATLEPELALVGARPLRETLSASLARRRFSMALLVSFAGLALLLAAIGLYGVLAYLVAQRNREIGIRMALGATERSVLGDVLSGGLKLAATGIGLGLVVAVAVVRVLHSMLFGVRAFDLPTFLGVPLLLLAVAVVATLLPARRAAKVDPVEILRK